MIKRREGLAKHIKVCKQCGKEFIPASHGGTKVFCSHSCANKFMWIKRKEDIAKKLLDKKTCVQCGKEFERARKLSITQWRPRKFCSPKCTGEAFKIKDGLSKSERYQRKKGAAKMFTQEWYEKIKATTKQGMLRPEVQEKIRKPKGPMTQENKIIRSDALAGIMPKNLTYGNRSQFSNVQRGEYECSKGSIYFRSKWEANYALYLDFLIKHKQISDWLFEEDTFFFEKIKLGTRSYTPDFKIFNNDGSIEYHEVKGYMDARSKTKLKRMQSYYPETKLVLIDREYYTDMLKRMKGLIRFNS